MALDKLLVLATFIIKLSLQCMKAALFSYTYKQDFVRYIANILIAR